MSLIAKLSQDESEIIDLKEGAIINLPPEEQPLWKNVMNTTIDHDNLTQVAIISGFTNLGSAIQIEWIIQDLPPFWVKYRLKQYATNLRQAKVQSGLTTLPDGSKLDGSVETRVNLIGAFLALQNQWAPFVHWRKSTGESVQLDLAAITGISQLIINHIQQLYVNESTIHAQIDAGIITSKTQIDSFVWHQ